MGNFTPPSSSTSKRTPKKPTQIRVNLSLENTIFEKPHRVQVDPLAFFRVKPDVLILIT